MPTETAATAAAWAKYGHIFGGALGIAATLAMMQTMTTRQMVLATSSGFACCIFGTPVAMAIARGYLPASAGQDVTDALAGLLGSLLGLLGIYIVGGIINMAESFRDNPWAVIDRLRGIKKGSDE